MPFSKQEFTDCLDDLGLDPVKAAELLYVTPRTVMSWIENPQEIPETVEKVLHSYQRLRSLMQSLSNKD